PPPSLPLSLPLFDGPPPPLPRSHSQASLRAPLPPPPPSSSSNQSCRRRTHLQLARHWPRGRPRRHFELLQAPQKRGHRYRPRLRYRARLGAGRGRPRRGVELLQPCQQGGRRRWHRPGFG
ncbi:unnamed protein product, partial [Ectocarpus sp. 12 AP-2014]